DLALLPGARRELVPLGILQPRHVVDRVVEIDVNVVGAEPPETAFERAHHRVAAVTRAGVGLVREVDAVALAVYRLPDSRLRVPAVVAVGGVEVVDPAIERVPDGVARAGPQLASAEGDGGYPHAGAAERRIALHRRRAPARRLGRGPERKGAQAEAGEHPLLQQPAAPEVRAIIRHLHGSSPVLPGGRWIARAILLRGPGAVKR